MHYQEGGQQRELQIPKGDVLYQFRKDVEEGKLPTVSWLAVRPSFYSDHPDSPWFGAWYVSEIMDILTQNPEVLEKDNFYTYLWCRMMGIRSLCTLYSTKPWWYRKWKSIRGNKPCIGICTDRRCSNIILKAEEKAISVLAIVYRWLLLLRGPEAGWVNSQVFDHTSSLQFLEKFINSQNQ